MIIIDDNNNNKSEGTGPPLNKCSSIRIDVFRLRDAADRPLARIVGEF